MEGTQENDLCSFIIRGLNDLSSLGYRAYITDCGEGDAHPSDDPDSTALITTQPAAEAYSLPLYFRLGGGGRCFQPRLPFTVFMVVNLRTGSIEVHHL